MEGDELWLGQIKMLAFQNVGLPNSALSNAKRTSTSPVKYHARHTRGFSIGHGSSLREIFVKCSYFVVTQWQKSNV